MKTFTKLGFAAALLAGSALTTNAVIAQEAQQPKMEQPGADTSAKPKAPGQTKTEGESATQMAPGQKQNSGSVGSATEAAPGQTKTEGQADSGGTAGEPKPNENAATEEAPGQKQKAGQADATDAAPTTVEFHPLPARIVEIVPQYRGYEYFVLADGRIIIVEPSSHEVVYIIVV